MSVITNAFFSNFLVSLGKNGFSKISDLRSRRLRHRELKNHDDGLVDDDSYTVLRKRDQ